MVEILKDNALRKAAAVYGAMGHALGQARRAKRAAVRQVSDAPVRLRGPWSFGAILTTAYSCVTTSIVTPEWASSRMT